MSNKLNLALGLVIFALIIWALLKPNANPSLPNSTSEGTQDMPITQNTNHKQYQQAEQVIEEGKSYTAIIKTTAGDITVELSSATPVTTNNFIFLAKEGFYDGVIFHRVIKDFMIQGGDPTGTGMGGPGYKFADEEFTGEYERGTIAMANSGPNTNGSQFFILHVNYDLPPNYVIFGKTISGLEVVDQIATTKTTSDDRPVEPITINSIEIISK